MFAGILGQDSVSRLEVCIFWQFSIVTIASGLDLHVLIHMVSSLEILLHFMDAHSWFMTHIACGILGLVMSDVPDMCKGQVGCSIGRSANVHVSILLDLSLGAPGFNFCQEVVLKSRVNWRAVCSDVAQMPWGVNVRSPVMVDVLDVEIGRIIEV